MLLPAPLQTPRRNLRRLVALRLLLVVPLLIATLVLHLSGTDLVILRIARIVLLAALVGGLALLRGRRRLGESSESDEPGSHSEQTTP